MAKPRVLIVDDERNIRLTLQGALEAIGLEVEAVMQGEEALQKLTEKDYDVMILDLRLPGMDGLAVLRQAADRFPETKVIIITAYGTVEAVVDAMKLGAVDFLQKPFEPQEVREIVGRVLALPVGGPTQVTYENYLDLAKKNIKVQKLSAALVYVHKAVFVNPRRPEAFNLLGGLHEVRDQKKEAVTNYRVALELDPSYRPAQKNLERATGRPYSKIGIVWE
jgi:two-component system, OmpR family, alkaline phosphatase synthesis response regulator PhoP